MDINKWLNEAKQSKNADKIGMYLIHNGTVRKTAKKQVRNHIESADVIKMNFSYDQAKVQKAIDDTLKLPGIYYLKVWLNQGILDVNDDIMYILIGGDIRPNVTYALDHILNIIKNECVIEEELYG